MTRLVSGGPVRRIRSGHRGIRGVAPVAGRQVAFESALERDFLALLAFDPLITDVHGQPVRIEFTDPLTGRARHYTPDVLASYDPAAGWPGQVLYEVKYRADLRVEWARLKPAFLAARRHAREQGMRFSVVTEAQIRGPRLDNARFLAGHIDRRRDEAVEERLLRLLAASGETTPQSLLASAFPDQGGRGAAIGQLWRLVATRHIQADLSWPLTMATPIRLVPAEETRR